MLKTYGYFREYLDFIFTDLHVILPMLIFGPTECTEPLAFDMG